jgi:alkylation response protein AidB-like acyl-CoA dehydrogenase
MRAEGRLTKLAGELAAEAEAERRLSAEFSGLLAEAGLYRLCVPASLGGGEAAPAELLRAVEALAEGDAAVGWCVAVCATSGMLGAYLEPEAAADVYSDPAGVVGGVFAPSGRAVADGDRLVVSGRWRFCSNVDNCDWVMGGCVVFDGDAPRTLESGRPDIRLVLMPADAVDVIDTWSVSGLRATGSHDIAVEGLEVPAARAASLITDPPREPGPLYAFPPFGLLAAAIAAVALGAARGALDEIGDLAGAKTPTLSTRKLAERPATQSGIARAEAAVRAARALLFEATADCWAAAQRGGEISVRLRAGMRLASTNAVEASAFAIDEAYRLGGGSAIYETSPLQRRFRDIHAATQHMLVAPATWELAGRSLLGLDFDASQL